MTNMGLQAAEATKGPAELQWIEVSGLRTLERFKLELSPLTVLIGANGSGKSSVLQAFEILRSATSTAFASDLAKVHGWPYRLAREAGGYLHIRCRLRRADRWLEYELKVDPQGVIAGEQLEQEPYAGRTNPLIIIQRDRRGAKAYRRASNGSRRLLPVDIDDDQPVLAMQGSEADEAYESLKAVRNCLSGIDVHVAYDVLPEWVARLHQRRVGVRGSAPVQREKRLSRLADNLAGIYHRLRNDFGEAHWRTTMEYVRLGLGDRVESINTVIDPGGGAFGLAMKLESTERQIPAASLSDGELSYLGFVAIARLDEGRTLLAFDEPETHLHPALLARVVQMMEGASGTHPVVLSTHSDRVLDLLSSPADSTCVLEVDPASGVTRSLRLDAARLGEWLDRYSLGELRSEGLLASIMREPTHR